MKHIRLLPIDKMGWPVEMIEGKPVLNFIRRLIHAHHYECQDCWYRRQDAVWLNPSCAQQARMSDK